MAQITVEEGQNLMDVTLQHIGDMGALFDLALLNGISPTAKIKAGDKLELPAVVNQGLVDYFVLKQVIPATETQMEEFNRPGGIDYMKIEYDFRVS